MAAQRSQPACAGNLASVLGKAAIAGEMASKPLCVDILAAAVLAAGLLVTDVLWQGSS